MSQIKLRHLPRGAADHSNRVSLGMTVVPDVADDRGWATIVEKGVPHYAEWTQGVIRPKTKPFALSYKHMEHDFGKLSHEQAQELRQILTTLVGPGPDRAVLWIDSMYMMREGLGFKDYSSRWVEYGLVSYSRMPVIRLESAWNKRHEASGKRSAWLWLERALGAHNYGVHSTEGLEKEAKSIGLSVKDALKMWEGVSSEYGFRPDDEAEVRAQIAGVSSGHSKAFRCPGACACISFMLGRREKPCGGKSEHCVELAKSTNGSFSNGKLVLSTVGRIADSVLVVTEPVDGVRPGHLQRESLSEDGLRQFTKILNSRQLPFRNVRWLMLERYQGQ